MAAFLIKRFIETMVWGFIYSIPSMVGIILLIVGAVGLIKPNVYTATTTGRIHSWEPNKNKEGTYKVVLLFIRDIF